MWPATCFKQVRSKADLRQTFDGQTLLRSSFNAIGLFRKKGLAGHFIFYFHSFEKTKFTLTSMVAKVTVLYLSPLQFPSTPRMPGKQCTAVHPMARNGYLPPYPIIARSDSIFPSEKEFARAERSFPQRKADFVASEKEFARTENSEHRRFPKERRIPPG